MKLDTQKSALIFILFGLLFCSVAWSAEQESPDEKEEVRATAIAFNKAYAANDLEKYFSFYTDDATLVIPTGDPQTVAEYRAVWKAFLDSGSGVANIHLYEPTSIRVSPDGQSALVYFAPTSVVYFDAEGTESDYHFAESDTWWKIDGEWKVAHIHYHEIE